MISGATIECTSADETLAVLVITPELSGEEASISGLVRGPYCERARTLPAEFVVKLHDDGTLVAMIVDPCYSTDELTMEYQLELWLESRSERRAGFETVVELKKK